MILDITHIAPPYSGEYEERIFDIHSNWNSQDWTWIRFEEESLIWCGEFRGKYRGAVLSKTKGIVAVLTSDYMYLLDCQTKEIIDYKQQPEWTEITRTPSDDILVSNGYGLELLAGRTITSLSTIVLPVNADNLTFIGYSGDYLEMRCEEFGNWSHSLRLLMDCASFEVSESIL